MRLLKLLSIVSLLSTSVQARVSQETETDSTYAVLSSLLCNQFVSQDNWGMDRARIDEDTHLKLKNNKGCDYENDVKKTAIVIRATEDSAHLGVHGMKLIQHAELDRKDFYFCTAGANFYIDANGFVYACRELNKKAAVSIPNAGVIGVGLMGYFDGDTSVSPEMRSSLTNVIGTLLSIYGPLAIVPLSSRNAQARKQFPNNPGHHVLAILESVNAEAKELAIRLKNSEGNNLTSTCLEK